MSERFQLISDNFSLLRLQRATLQLSTVELPVSGIVGYRYESCLFHESGDSDIVGRYQTLNEAVSGHTELCQKYGLS